MNPPDAAKKAPVSVIVSVKNEEKNIRRCLEHLAWADEVFVVDSASEDKTCEIAAEMGAKVVQFGAQKSLEDFSRKKNWAFANCGMSHEWALIVDADEVVTPELRDEIISVLAKPDCDGYFINFRYMFLGRWIKHCGYYPVWVLRLFRRDKGGYGNSPVHEHLSIKGKIGYLKNDMEHYAYPTLTRWVQKHDLYSSIEAENFEKVLAGPDREQAEAEKLIGFRPRFKRKLKRIYYRLPFRYLVRFFYAYVFRLGFLDGMPGFILCVLLTFYDFLIYAKVYEKQISAPGK
ncbi:MAG TPA: glycosyltransferase family 2 protein [Candidatus Brocadiia bacterium]|nr:glycosyltransferase family 2 protein [Candidatus Brocadiia bacterium]